MKLFKINRTNADLLNNLNDKENATILFYHPYCGHCIHMKPMWEQMKKKVKKENCNIYEVNGEDLLNVSHPIKNNVNGFPTILNLNNGKINSFEKERNTQNMVDFVLSNVSKNVKEKNRSLNNLKKRNISFYLNKNDNIIKKRIIKTNNKSKKTNNKSKKTNNKSKQTSNKPKQTGNKPKQRNNKSKKRK